ncbi:hypothetical protein WJX82_000161 [Trebouxia sp. C0006]
MFRNFGARVMLRALGSNWLTTSTRTTSLFAGQIVAFRRSDAAPFGQKASASTFWQNSQRRFLADKRVPGFVAFGLDLKGFLMIATTENTTQAASTTTVS